MSPRTGSLSSSVGDKSSSEAAMTSSSSSSSASAGGGGSRRFTVRERGPVELLEVHTRQSFHFLQIYATSSAFRWGFSLLG